MRKFLSWTCISLLMTAIMEPVVFPGFGWKIPWGRDLLMLVGGIGGLIAIYRNWDYL